MESVAEELGIVKYEPAVRVLAKERRQCEPCSRFGCLLWITIDARH